jgi:ATP-dependent Clp protease ATP-binding subunit ClpC
VHAWLVKEACRDLAYGARPLRRAMQRYLEDPLSEEIIRAGGISEDGAIARVTVENEELRFSVQRREAQVGAPA